MRTAGVRAASPRPRGRRRWGAGRAGAQDVWRAHLGLLQRLTVFAALGAVTVAYGGDVRDRGLEHAQRVAADVADSAAADAVGREPELGPAPWHAPVLQFRTV